MKIRISFFHRFGLGLAFMVLFIAFYEYSWRLAGYWPRNVDSFELFALSRAKINSSQNQLILLGDSRIMADIDPETLSSETGWPRAINLGMQASNFLPIFADVLEGHFRGTILCSITPFVFFNTEENSWSKDTIRFYHESTPAKFVDYYIGNKLNRVLAFTTRESNDILPHRPAPPRHLKLTPDRFLALDFSALSPDMLKMAISHHNTGYLEVGKPATEREVELILNHLANLTNKLEQNGGRIYFLRLPSDGGVRKAEAIRYPRKRYWDLLAKRVGEPTIHFEDFPALEGFHCPDGSHLDREDRPEFTRRLSKILMNYPTGKN